MTKAEIVEDIASKTGLTKKDVATAMDMFLESISKALSEGKHYEIRGFGTFKVKNRKSRMARNPRTGDSVPVPDRKVPVFKVSKELKDLVANVEDPRLTRARRCAARTNPARPPAGISAVRTHVPTESIHRPAQRYGHATERSHAHCHGVGASGRRRFRRRPHRHCAGSARSEPP